MARYYVKFEKVPFEEDQYHEFKGHRNLSKEELPKWTQETKFEKGSRKSISRNLCGFLNSGTGGTVYAGIIDSGEIHGLKLTQYMKDHIVGSMHDLMSRYSPPVDRQRYHIAFIPVLSATTNEEDRDKMAGYETKEVVKEEERRQPHRFRTPHYCWCDKDMMAQYNQGILVSDYVIEFKILPWDPEKDYSGSLGSIMKLNPIHADEEGQIYFRRQASLVRYTTSEISTLSRYESYTRSQQIIDSLQQELQSMRASIKQNKKEQLQSNDIKKYNV